MPDLKTLMLLYVITNVINAGAVAVIWSQNRKRFAGISFWLVTMVLQVVGSALHVLRGLVPDLISMTLANTIILAGVLIMLMGLERFVGKKGRQVHNYVLLAVFIAVSAYFVVVQPNLLARDIAVSAMLTIFTFQCCWLLLRRVDPGMRQITRLTGIVFAVYAAFNLFRISLNIMIPERSSDFYQSGAVNALAITGYIVLNLCLTISLVVMVNKRLLADVQAQEEKFTTAFHSAPYAITLTRPSDGAILEINDGFSSITGYQSGEVVGQTTLGLDLWVRKEDRLAVVNELEQGREVRAVEYSFRKKTGEVLTGLFSASVMTVDDEAVILSVIGDITERKQAEDALARLKDELEERVLVRTAELEEANRELASFAYSVSHDLRTPLRALDGYSLLLLDDYGAQLDDEARDHLARIRRAAQKMGLLIDGLLELSRLSRNELLRERVDLSELAGEVAREIEEAEPERKVELAIAEGLAAFADRQLARSLLANLMSNAWKFTAKHATARIEVGAVDSDGQRAFYVRDDGAGFDMAFADKLFGAFESVHSPGEFEGLGIGLATVQRIVRRHGGRVWAEGEVENGATFWFTLPDAGNAAPARPSSTLDTHAGVGEDAR